MQYPLHAVSRLLSICIYTGDVDLVQRVLRSGLGADAAGVNSQACRGERGELRAVISGGRLNGTTLRLL